MKRQTIALTIAGLLSITAAPVFASEFDEEPRWFEIEIIVYKSTNGTGLEKESWDTDVSLTTPEKLIDFIQPYEVLTPEIDATQIETSGYHGNSTTFENTQADTGLPQNSQAITQAQASQPEESTLDDSLDATGLNHDATGLDQDEAAFIPEQPFKMLDTELLQLANEASTLSRHPDYKVLLHQAWRQPVLNSRQAEFVRIAGGRDLSENFDYDGTKKVQLTDTDFGFNQNAQLPQDSLNSLDTNPNQLETAQNGYPADNTYSGTTISQENSEQILADDQSQQQDETTVDLTSLPMLPQLVASPWVPELDGNIQVYLNRYLHIKTNLFLRRPDKEEVEAIDLNMLNNDMLSSLEDTQNTLDQTSQLTADFGLNASEFQTSNNDDFLTNDFTQNNETQVSSEPFLNDQPQFTWDIDDNFLETESEKMYIERLFNYPLNQSRRVKSGELHFFDHPLIGVLIMIRPYEQPKPEEETDETTGR